MPPKLDSSLFTWGRWRGGTLADLGAYSRAIRASRRVLRQHVVGYAEGSSVPCRPKPGTKAVMFSTARGLFWTHLLNDEFAEVFG